MAQIKTYNQQVSRQAVSQPNVPAAGFGQGAGLEAVGKSIQSASQDFFKYAEEKDNFKVQTEIKKAHDTLSKQMREEADNDPNFGEGFTKKFEDKFSKLEEEMASLPQFNQSRKTMEDGLYKVKSSLMNEAMNIEATKGAIKVKRDITDSEQEMLNNITANPAAIQEQMGLHMNIVKAIPSKSLDEASKQKYAQDVSFRAYDTALDSKVRQATSSKYSTVGSVDRLIKEVRDPKSGWSKNTTNPQYEKALFTLQNTRETLRIKGQSEAKMEFEEYMSQVEDQGIPNTKYNKNSVFSMTDSPVEQRKLQERMEIAENRSKGMQYVSGSTDTEIRSKLQTLGAELKNVDSPQYFEKKAEYDRVAEAYIKRKKEIKEDFAGYALKNNITAQEKFKQFAANPSPETASDYASFMKAEQKRIDPSVPVSLMPMSMVNGYGEQLKSFSDSPEGADKAANLLGSLHKVWGRDFPLVVEEMRAAKKISNIQYTVANMMGVNGNKYLAKEMLRADSYKTDDLKSKIPNLPKNLEGEIDSDVIKALNDFAKTNTNSFDGLDVVSKYQESIKQTALFRAAMRGKYNSSDVAEITNQLVNEHYTFTDDRRIPKVSNNKVVNAESVETGVRTILSKPYLNNIEFVVPATSTRPEDYKSQMIASIMYSGKLINAGDDGLRLVTSIKDTGELHQVMRKGADGKPEAIVFSWDELQAMGIYSGLKPAPKESDKFKMQKRKSFYTEDEVK